MRTKGLPKLVILVEPIGAHGGMLNFDVSFCRALHEQGLDLIWATCDETKADISGCELWVPFHGIYGNASKWRRGIRYARGLFAVLWRAYKEIRRRPVIIHQQFITSLPLEWIFAFFVRLAGIPILLTPHDIVPFYAGKFLQGFLSMYYRQYDSVIVHSQDSLTELRQITDNNLPIQYIPHGNFNSIYNMQNQSIQSENRARLSLSDQVSVILFLGRIRQEKGLEYLIRAMQFVIQEFPKVLLLVAGKGEKDCIQIYENLSYELGLHNNVLFKWGYVSAEELPVYYRAADVVALPYTHIYQSGVVMTAYALRKPVVASNVGGLKEQVIDGKTGFLVPPGDVEALARGIINVLRDPVLANSMGDAGFEWAAKLGDWKKIAELTVKLYNQAWQKHHVV